MDNLDKKLKSREGRGGTSPSPTSTRMMFCQTRSVVYSQMQGRARADSMFNIQLLHCRSANTNASGAGHDVAATNGKAEAKWFEGQASVLATRQTRVFVEFGSTFPNRLA